MAGGGDEMDRQQQGRRGDHHVSPPPAIRATMPTPHRYPGAIALRSHMRQTMPHSPKTAPIFWRTAAAITNMKASLTQGHGSSSPPMDSQPTGFFAVAIGPLMTRTGPRVVTV